MPAMDDDDERPAKRARREEDDDEEDDRPRKKRRRRDDDDEEESDATGGVIPYKNPKALIAYYLGIGSFFLPIVGGIGAIVLGVMGFQHLKTHPRARGQVHAGIGIGCGLFTTLFWGFVVGAVAFGVFK